MTSSFWHPSASREMLAKRAQLLRRIREFMQARDVLEVETPVLSRAASTDPNLHSLRTGVLLPDSATRIAVHLHTSPEFFMKRLLAAGSGPIYQIAKVFRDGEAGRRHQPEFTMLEWYRPGFDQHELMDEIAALLGALDLPAPERTTYAEVFSSGTGLCPHTAPEPELRKQAAELGLCAGDVDRSALLDFLFDRAVAPRLSMPGGMLVHDYPACQAALATVRPGTPPVAERFELFLSGLEIANGFHELCDAAEQRRRFQEENARRQIRQLPPMPMDERLLAALEGGLPDCSGIALGVDRLLMALAACDHIDEVVSFPFDRT